jgi:hypothetical protein
LRRKTLALAAILAALTAACVRDRDPEPGIRAITTDLQYKQLREKSAAPPNTIPAEQPELDPGDLPRPTLRPFDQAPLGPVEPPSEACPTAAPTEQVDEDVESNFVKGKPAAGDYLWKVDGSEFYDDGSDPDDPDDDTRLSLPTFVKKEISDVEVEDEIIRYVMSEKELSALNPNAPTVRSHFQIDVEGGIVVTEIERTTPNGDRSIFSPLDPINYFVLPVRFGPETAWSSQSVDALSDEPQVLDHTAYIKGRITVDACGERIRGWHVVADQEYRKGAESIKRHFEYAVATQMGGIVIYEQVLSPCTWDAAEEECTETTPLLEFTSNIGQTKPS